MRLRVILDPNVLISHLLPSRHVSVADRIVDAAVSGSYQLLFSDELLHELITRVQRKPYLVRNVSSADLATLLDILAVTGERVETSDIALDRVVRDPDDDYLITLAVAGNADLLVTGDGDLHDIADLMPFRIMSPRTFADLLAEEGSTNQLR